MLSGKAGPLSMLATKKSTRVVGLDIETGSVAAAEVTVNGAATLGRTGIAALSPGVMRDGEVADADALGGMLKEFFAEHKLPRNVRMGVANQRVVVRTLRMPLIEKADELEAAVRFQAAEQIPMPLEQAVLDWRVVDSEPAVRESRQMDVVVVAARRETVSGLARALRSAGLKPVGIDISAFAMIRALAGEGPATGGGIAPTYEERVAAGDDGGAMGAPVTASLYCNLGDVTNLAVARGRDCLFTRVSSFGIEGIAQRLAERRELTIEHARQWLGYVGLERPLEEIEGDPENVQASREALIEGASALVGELRLSLDFYGTQEGAVAVGEIVACGAGTAIPGLPEQIERELGYGVRVCRPAALSGLDDGTAARLTLSYGLALEE